MFSPRIGKSIRLELILSAIIFVGLFLVNGSRVWEFFWSDEIITIEATGLSWSELVVNRYWAAHSPLYFAILKVWLGVLSMFVDIQEHAEFLARLPSAVATTLAGGFLAGAVWRSWSYVCAIIFIPAWTVNNFIPHYAFEARPFGLLLLALSLSVWSISRLWSDTYAKNSRYLWITSALSPIVAAATIPLGIVAVIAMELSAASLLRSHQSRDFVVRWYARTGVVVGAVIVLMAIYGPAILNKSDNYWVEQYAPMSLASVSSVFRIVALQGGRITGWIFLCAAVLGLYLRWTSILGRLAAGLVVLYTALMFTISVFASLMIPRYFLPAVPGLILLAAGSAGARAYSVRSSLAALAVASLAISMWLHRPHYQKNYGTDKLIALLKKNGITEMRGVVTRPQHKGVLKYYLPRKLGVVPELEYVADVRNLPGIQHGGLFWVFTKHFSSEELNGWSVVCVFDLKQTKAYVLSQNHSPPLKRMRGCRK